MKKVYTSEVLEILENGDAIIGLPEELLKEVCWYTGDVLDITEKDGKIFLRNLTKEKDR
jgi:hypothetical protein